MSVKALDAAYEIRTGYENTHGIPAVLWIAMGLQENPNGPGRFNNYQKEVLWQVDYDRGKAAEIGWADVRSRLAEMADKPGYAVDFFKTKLQMQWLDPLYETLQSTSSFAEEVPLPGWIGELYFGKYHDPLARFADRYQSVVYLAFLLFVLSLCRRQKANAAFYLPLIAIVGGFLFSMIWESQCRYVLPYYLFMLPYAAEGIALAGKMLGKSAAFVWERLRRI